MLLEARDVKKIFPKGRVKAVDGVSLTLQKGETLGIVGESGSGKSTLAKLLLGLLRPDAGAVYFEGIDTATFDRKALRRFRKKAQIIFQNPFLSLDPRMTVDAILREPFLLDGERKNAFLKEKVSSLLASVELPAHFALRHAGELSGGECQRVSIARAMSRDPEFLICDEPVSSLDLVSRARILNLLLKLQIEKKASLLFITHDLHAARHMSDEILVMKEGRICERGPRDEIFNSLAKTLPWI